MPLSKASNQLKGDIPHEFSTLNLVTFDVGSNELGGPLVTEIGLMSHLETLRLNDNHFSGNIPDQLGKLVHLNELHLNGNDLSGSLPSSLSNLVALGESQNCHLYYYFNLLSPHAIFQCHNSFQTT